jgi:hypothetical protein
MLRVRYVKGTAYYRNLREHSRQLLPLFYHRPPLVLGNYLEGSQLSKGGRH